MPHVQPLSKNQASDEARPVLDAIEENFGHVLNIFGTLAHQPDVLKGVTKINDGIREDLPDKLRELAYLKSSLLNNCKYCSHYHRLAAKKAGVSEAQLEAIDDYDAGDSFTEQEQAVLAYADELTRTVDVDSKVVDRVSRFLSDKQLVTLAATVALANFTNRFNHGLAIELP